MNHSSEKRIRVLIVEDEPTALEASRIYLGLAGHDVAVAGNAADALDAAEQRPPDVLVCDWQLGNGPDGARVAREVQGRYGVAVIFVTAHPIDELVDATSDLRVARYFRKPVQLDELAAAIELATV